MEKESKEIKFNSKRKNINTSANHLAVSPKQLPFVGQRSVLCSIGSATELTENASQHHLKVSRRSQSPPRLSPKRSKITRYQSEESDIFDETDDKDGDDNDKSSLEDVFIDDNKELDVADETVSNSSSGGGTFNRKSRPSSYKAYHRQIEKRRRNKISSLISEIGTLVPMCVNASHRLDKLSMLELAVQQVRMLRKSDSDENDTIYRPTFLSEDEMKSLVDQNGFLLVLSCNQAHILYASDSVTNCTYYRPSDLLGQSLLDIIHPNDVELVTSMLMPYSNLPTVGSVSMYTGAGITGARRTFYFRLKTTASSILTPGASKFSQRPSTIPVKATGFLKTWQAVPPSNGDATAAGTINSSTSSSSSTTDRVDSSKLIPFTCFICMVKPLQNSSRSHEQTDNGTEDYQQYSSKHSADAVYLSVDQRVFPMSGYLPQELIGNSEYSFVHKDDVKSLSDTYRQVLANNNQEKVVSDIYRFKLKHGGMLPMRTVATSLFNPFTHELEFISHQNYVIGSREDITSSSSETDTNTDFDRPEDCKSLRLASPKLDLPVFTPETLSFLREAGLKPKLLSNFVNFQRVSSCSPSLHAVSSPAGESSSSASNGNESMSSNAEKQGASSTTNSSGYASGMEY